MAKSVNIVVVGGGASGFFTAINVARLCPQAKVTILEKTSKVLSKVKASGGGRCNVTHASLPLSEFTTFYPRGKNFLKKAFHQFDAAAAAQWFEERGVVLKTETDGRIFPKSNQSQSIIDCLLAEADKYQIEILYNVSVDKIFTKNDIWQIQAKDNRTWSADYLSIATGGFQKKSQYDWLASLGLLIENPVPSLFTFNTPQNPITQLMGLSVPNAIASVSHTKLSEEGPLLITHWGLSGPAILKLSARGARILEEKKYQFTVTVNWLGIKQNVLQDEWAQYVAQMGHKTITHNPFNIASRLWMYFIHSVAIDSNKKWNELKQIEKNKLVHLLTTSEFEVSGKTTFKEEFVTCGGVSLQNLNAATMEAKALPNLYFTGEIVDVDGLTGGFNFQNAWTTGWLVAQAIANKMK